VAGSNGGVARIENRQQLFDEVCGSLVAMLLALVVNAPLVVLELGLKALELVEVFVALRSQLIGEPRRSALVIAILAFTGVFPTGRDVGLEVFDFLLDQLGLGIDSQIP
jgi:hypothetical protein